ncbi:MAG: magnesium transporter [Sporocytophaga sp.]|uniref:CorA family divalent cation transporter n=1 Tax=Sporocytophaga sp. TaxID=2231183 RepID=UPI001B2C3F98|nr:CorA family divalent cation transporter [Sporocytophaga sp.]MBO9701822.1 magnesium transporter [Sporocytophaga sp.]
MIELILKSRDFHKINNTNEIKDEMMDFISIQFLDFKQEEIDWVKEKFGLDFSIMNHTEDIEVSSHYFENENQASFHFSIPYFNKTKHMVEEPLFIIISSNRVFVFLTSSLDDFFNKTYSFKFNASIKHLSDPKGMFKMQVEYISDYYADVTESLAKRIKTLASRVLIEKEFTDKDLDIITQYNFNNLLVKESINETKRIFSMYKKGEWEKRMNVKETIDIELNDLAVVSDYIQFNFDRLDDLKENISNKIELEQNHIFKILTMVTVCIAFPTLIAGVYGMNFEMMPELKWKFGYPTAISIMFLSVVFPIIYFKRKRWL